MEKAQEEGEPVATHDGADGPSRVWPRSAPPILHCWVVDDSHDNDARQELLQLLYIVLMAQPLLDTGATRDVVASDVLLCSQMVCSKLSGTISEKKSIWAPC